MLKTVSSITNAIGALNYKGTWDANANSPALASSVGTKGDYYVVGTAGATNLNGITNWGIGDWAAFNGSVWQRVEGGANLNGVDLSVSGTTTLSGLTASTALALDANKNVVSVTNTGTGNNVLQTAPTLVGDVTLSTGNLVIGTAGKGIQGTTTNNNADAGVVGEYVSSTVLTGSAVTINYGGSGVPVTSISLTAGDWDVTGWVGYNIGAGSVVTYLIQGTSTSNTLINGESSNVFNQIASTGPQIPIPIQRFSIASTTTIYLSSATGGSGTALTAYGTIRARRIR
jgi:hypothetical protein